MSTFVLKIIALASMIIDHVGAAFPQYFGLEFRIIGRIAFPIFVYLIAEGFRHTRSPERFLVRLGVFAIISEPFFDLTLWTDWRLFQPGNLFSFAAENINFLANTNIFVTLFLGGCAIAAYKKIRSRADGSPLLIVTVTALTTIGFMAVADLLTSDYGAYGVLFIFIMYAISTPKLRIAAMVPLALWQHRFILLMPFYGNIHQMNLYHILFVAATLIPVVLVAFYNGKPGPRSFKWLFYAAYPFHLAVLLGFLLVNTI